MAATKTKTKTKKADRNPESWKGQANGAPPPALPWTVDIASAVWGITARRIHVLFIQGRIEGVQRGKKNIIIIQQTERPRRAAPGELDTAQREVKDRAAGRQHQHRGE